MNCYFSGRVCALTAALALSTSYASAAIINFSGTSSDGHAVSATAEFTPASNTVTVKLTNTTANTLDAGEFFTGLDFSFGGLTPSLSAKTAILRTVNGNGTYTDTGSAQDISWSLVSKGSGVYQLNFNPDAEHSIIAPPSGSTYTGNGSLSNNGHNPFAAVSATFVLTVSGATAATPVNVTTFRFGTSLDAATGTIAVPEPATCMPVIAGLLYLLVVRVSPRYWAQMGCAPQCVDA